MNYDIATLVNILRSEVIPSVEGAVKILIMPEKDLLLVIENVLVDKSRDCGIWNPPPQQEAALGRICTSIISQCETFINSALELLGKELEKENKRLEISFTSEKNVSNMAIENVVSQIVDENELRFQQLSPPRPVRQVESSFFVEAEIGS
jgi:hypothetical protein